MLINSRVILVKKYHILYARWYTQIMYVLHCTNSLNSGYNVYAIQNVPFSIYLMSSWYSVSYNPTRLCSVTLYIGSIRKSQSTDTMIYSQRQQCLWMSDTFCNFPEIHVRGVFPHRYWNKHARQSSETGENCGMSGVWGMQCRGRVFRFLSQGLDLEVVCVCVCSSCFYAFLINAG